MIKLTNKEATELWLTRRRRTHLAARVLQPEPEEFKGPVKWQMRMKDQWWDCTIRTAAIIVTSESIPRQVVRLVHVDEVNELDHPPEVEPDSAMFYDPSEPVAWCDKCDSVEFYCKCGETSERLPLTPTT